MTGDGPMDEDDADPPVDPEVRAFLIEALAGVERPGQRERVLAAIEAEGRRLRQEEVGKAAAVVPLRPRRVWQTVAILAAALAAVAVAAMYYRGHVHNVTAPDVDPQEHFAAPVPPHRGP